MTDSIINDALRIVTGCLRPTPTDNLLILASIQPAGLRREEATLALVRRALEPRHLLHFKLARSSIGTQRRLKSRHPFVPAVQDLLKISNDSNIGAADWLDCAWNKEWKDNITRLHTSIIYTIGNQDINTVWVRFNRLRTGVKRLRSNMCNSRLAPSAACE